jgi:hypothetical protein
MGSKVITNSSAIKLVNDPEFSITPVAAYDFRNGSLRDLVGSNHGTKYGSLDFSKGRYGTGVRGDEQGSINLGTGFNGQTDFFCSFWMTFQPSTLASTSWVINQFTSAIEAFGIFTITNKIAIYDDIDNANLIRYETTLISGQTYHIVFGINDANLCKMWIDGVAADNDESVSSGFETIGGGLSVLGRSYTAISAPYDGSISNLEIYDQDLTDADVLSIYNRSKRIVSRFDAGLIASGNTISSGFIENTPIQVYDGNHSITSNGTSKYLYRSSGYYNAFFETSNFGVNPVEAAYGTWHIPYYKNTLASTFVFSFISLDKQYALSTNNGYILYQTTTNVYVLSRVTNGSLTSLVTSVDIGSGVDYEIMITRNYNGLFKVYFKGGAFVNWTLKLTATDNTHTKSYYFGVKNSSNDKLYLQSDNPDYTFWYSPVVKDL